MLPVHRGEAVREYLRTPGLGLRLVNLPGYSPDFNADEAIWGWVREEATGNLCLGTKTAVQARVSHFFAGLANRKAEVKRRCRTVLQSRAERLLQNSQRPPNAHPTLASEPVSEVGKLRRCTLWVNSVGEAEKCRFETWTGSRCGF